MSEINRHTEDELLIIDEGCALGAKREPDGIVKINSVRCQLPELITLRNWLNQQIGETEARRVANSQSARSKGPRGAS